MRHYVRSLIAFAAFALLIAGTQLPSAASTGLQLLVQQWDPHNPSAQNFQNVFDNATFFDSTLNQVWSLARGQICSQAVSVFGKKDLLGKGFSLYNIDCELGSSGTFQIQNVNNGTVSASFSVPGNSFTATSTQNTICGSECDPRFSIGYDLTLWLKFTVIPLQVQSLKAQISNTTLDSKNAAGDVLKAIDSFFSLGFVSKAEKQIDSTQKLDPSQINGLLATQSNNQVAQLAKQFQYVNMWHAHSRLIIDFAPVFSANGPESLSGTVWWTKASQINISDCSKIALSTTVQTGPPQMSFPYAAFSAAPTSASGSLTMSGAPADLGDHYACNYTISALPTNLPGTTAGQANGSIGPPQPTHATIAFQYLAVQPDGWSGTTVLSAPQAGYNFQIITQTGRINTIVNLPPQTGIPINPGILRANPVDIQAGPLTNSTGKTAVQAGLTQFRVGNFVGALSSFNAALATDPANYVALYDRGLTQLRLGKLSEGEADLQRAAMLARDKGDTALAVQAEQALQQLRTSVHAGQIQPR